MLCWLCVGEPLLVLARLALVVRAPRALQDVRRRGRRGRDPERRHRVHHLLLRRNDVVQQEVPPARNGVGRLARRDEVVGLFIWPLKE